MFGVHDAVQLLGRLGLRVGSVVFRSQLELLIDPATKGLPVELRKGGPWRRRIWVESLSGEPCWIWQRLVSRRA